MVVDVSSGSYSLLGVPGRSVTLLVETTFYLYYSLIFHKAHTGKRSKMKLIGGGGVTLN